VQDLITHTKGFYTLLTLLSNTAVDASWLQDKQVLDLVSRREQLAQSVQGRRTDLGSVARVRCTFMCIDAIDNTLRHICRLRDIDETAAGKMRTALEIPCHRYWLEQTKHNVHNSVTLEDKTFSDAAELMQICQELRDGRRLLPIPVTTALKSTLGGVVWQSMHLQGLASSHVLPLAPCAHFMYKQRARVDYAAHPVVANAVVPTVPLALLTMLVCADVEHRIIPPRLGSHILTQLERATGKDAADDSVAQTTAFLERVFDPCLHSLVNAALAPDAKPYDTRFMKGLSSANTGYNMQEVTSYCLEGVI
jgi:hypothetical protein